MQAFRNQPCHPLHSLCVGLTFFHMASQKFVTKRHPVVLQVCNKLDLFSSVADISYNCLAS